MDVLSNFGQVHLLLVDDDPAVLTTFKVILEHQNFRVTEASTFAKAIALASHEDFDCLITDLFLDDHHSGFEVITAARSRKADIPCILVTGDAFGESERRAVQENVAFIAKPMKMDELKEMILSFLNESRRRAV